ncbi:hypothetical protein TRFO_07664 [Tritrichomonas foetus]|uniref:Uncharacterized protein n=1 Tax=Tritrichomonas foetus TaxID=1144522 RepID=A0A1J4JU16_9EUKA|nr:hypothetical protein TRFO_07664 [Tritrichomonas foetus]|eukprot:OHT01004.1 hypothetical protein TRFO_07664 [Tritrichomonas foetus]
MDIDDENNSDLYKAHYSVKPPKPKKSKDAGQPKKIDNLVDLEHNLFELTLSRFAPTEPTADPKHRPVRRVRVWDHHGDKSDTSFSPNVNHIVGKLHDCEHFRTEHMNSNKDFHAELRASEARLKLVKRGVPLYRILKSPTVYTPIEPQRRFVGVNEVIHKIPAKYTGIPPVRKIQFVYPMSARQPDRVDLVSKINLSESAKTRLNRTKQRGENLQLQYHNEMVDYLNHVNERRVRAAEQFFDDMADQGIDHAQLKAKRSLQRSRLRVMCKVEWWEDFISYAFSEETISHREEKFIEKMARHPTLSPAEFIDLFREIEGNPKSGRCLDWLNWINERCGVIDNVTLRLMLEDRDLKRIKKND